MTFAELFPSHSSFSYLPDVLYTTKDEMTTTKKKEESKPQNQVSKSFDKASVKKQEELSSSTIPFPWKVHQLLNDAETQGFTHIVSWLPGHTAFRVHKQNLFVQEIMPRYFKQTKYRSFRRQLNLWGFERLLRGPNRGGYQNANFVHRRPSLCHKMKRVEIKGIENMKLAMASAPIKTMNSMKDMKSGLPDNMLSFSSSIIEWKDPSSMDLFDDDTLSSVLPNCFFDVSPGSDDQSPIESIENERRIQTEMTLSIGEQRINPFFFTYSQ